MEKMTSNNGKVNPMHNLEDKTVVENGVSKV